MRHPLLSRAPYPVLCRAQNSVLLHAVLPATTISRLRSHMADLCRAPGQSSEEESEGKRVKVRVMENAGCLGRGVDSCKVVAVRPSHRAASEAAGCCNLGWWAGPTGVPHERHAQTHLS